MKCPFCSNPCGNSHCPYYEDQIEHECNKQIKGLVEENIRLKDHIKQLETYISDKIKK